MTESKENQSPSSAGSGLPYRSVFAVLTMDSILVYDTHHTRPLSVIRGLHYAGLSDCQWSSDGMKLIVSSIDGYISIVIFHDGELGEVYKRPQRLQPIPTGSPALPEGSSTTVCNSLQQSINGSTSNKMAFNDNISCSQQQSKPAIVSTRIPPCEPGQSATIEAPPSKRPKKTRIAPTLVSAGPGITAPVATDPLGEATTKNTNNAFVNNSTPSKRPANELLEKETNTVGEAVTKLTLNNDEQPKKKKRIQPMLVSN